MEHAFRGVHGFGYSELRNSQDLRLEVEQRRQRDHEKSVELLAKIDVECFSRLNKKILKIHEVKLLHGFFL